MKQLVLISLLALWVGDALAQKDVRASWIEIVKSSSQLEIRLYQQFARPQQLDSWQRIEEYMFNEALGNWTLNRILNLSSATSFSVEQNLYYPNCGNWIGALPCRNIQIHRYHGSFSLPGGGDTLKLRYVHHLTDLPVMNNLSHADSSIDALCYTDFHFLRNSNLNNHTPRVFFTEDWHRYFPIIWTAAQPNEAFINAYIPFQFSTNTPRGNNFVPLYTSFNGPTNTFVPASDFSGAGNDTAIFIFARQLQPFQIGIRSTETRSFRLATPITLWNKLNAVDSNLTYVFWVGETEASFATNVLEMEENSRIVEVDVYDLLGRKLFSGEDLSNFVRPTDPQVLLVVEKLANGKKRSKKWLQMP